MGKTIAKAALGSGLCGGKHLGQIVGYIDNIQNNRQYYNGQHIACVKYSIGNGECAFLQGTNNNGLSGQRIKELIHSLQDHKVSICSVEDEKLY